MNRSKNISIDREIFLFFCFTFIISWLIQIPRLLVDKGIVSLPSVLVVISTAFPIGPMFAAFIVTYSNSGLQGIKKLWNRAWNFKFDKKWLLITLLVPVVTSGITIAAIYLIGKLVPWQHQSLPPLLSIPIFIAIYLTQALPEEIGWRGFALDHLQDKYNALTASLILGFVWGLWHLPLHFMRGTTQEVIPVIEFILKQMVGSIFYTWIYNNSNKNLFLIILLHALWNVGGGLIPYWVTPTGRWVSFIVEVVLAIVVIIIFGAERMTIRDRKPHE